MPIFGNYVSQVAYIIAAVIIVLTEEFILDKIVVPIMKRSRVRNRKIGKILTPIIGTIIFVFWAAFGITLVSFLLGFGIINNRNVWYIALVTFLIIMFVLNKKYRMRWF